MWGTNTSTPIEIQSNLNHHQPEAWRLATASSNACRWIDESIDPVEHPCPSTRRALVPLEKLSNSKTPAGPFQTTSMTGDFSAYLFWTTNCFNLFHFLLRNKSKKSDPWWIYVFGFLNALASFLGGQSAWNDLITESAVRWRLAFSLSETPTASMHHTHREPSLSRLLLLCSQTAPCLRGGGKMAKAAPSWFCWWPFWHGEFTWPELKGCWWPPTMG